MSRNAQGVGFGSSVAVDFDVFSLEPLRGRLRELHDAETSKLARPYRLSMSVGAAFTDLRLPQTLAELLDRADDAMYDQKRARQEAGGVSVRPAALSHSHD